MTDAPVSAEGGCRCGRVRFRVTGTPLFTAACHCRGCQRMSASAFSVTGAWPADRLEIVAGEPVIGGLRDATRHHFCGFCMSWMFTAPEGMDLVNVRTTLLDTPPQTPPFFETYIAERLSWATTGATHSFAAFPLQSAFDGLLKEFAAAQTG